MAQKSWEVTQVNEMLVRMEEFDGIFIATTNLMDNLDQASLRRFDLKMQFEYLDQIQRWKLLLAYAKKLKLNRPYTTQKRALSVLNHLTPGDFEAVARQSKFRVITEINEFVKRLEEEMMVKKLSKDSRVGFKGLD